MSYLVKTKRLHEPVLLDEVVRYLRVEKIAHLKKDGLIIDATLGLGGHSIAICAKGASVLGIEADSKSLEVARINFEKACPSADVKKNIWRKYKLVHGNFKDIDKIAKKFGFENVDGILFDLGLSSYQLTLGNRGFSFANSEAFLDMRIDPQSQLVKASDLLNFLDEKKLRIVFSRVLDLKTARLISKSVIRERKYKKIEKVGDFLEIVNKVVPKTRDINKATLPFLALRIAVNSEFENLKEALPKAFALLKKGGRLVVISFHSGEDRIVKNFFKEAFKKGSAKILTKKPIVPSDAEIKSNPASRSAKMRVLEKL